jgi:adenylate kinase
VGDVVAENECYEGRDEDLDTMILDEDKLLDALEAILAAAVENHDDDSNDDNDPNDDDNDDDDAGGIVMDYHSCDFFPERWFDLVLVLQCDTAVLYDRLTARNYNDRKRSENVTAEIMQVVLEEARSAYDPGIVHPVPNNTLQDMDSNIQRVQIWKDQWIQDQRKARNEEKILGT